MDYAVEQEKKNLVIFYPVPRMNNERYQIKNG